MFVGTAVVLALLFAVGIVGFVIRLGDSFESRAPWGYYATVFGFLFSAAQAAPIAAFAPRLARGQWHRSMSRVSQVIAVTGLLNMLLFLPLLWLTPPSNGLSRPSMWFTWPWGAPHVWDTIFVLMLVLNGLAFLWVQALPDLAAIRARTGGRARLASWLASGFVGTPRQWRMLRVALAALGGFYLMNFVATQSLVAVDFAESLVPGWKSSMFPAFYTVNGLQAGVALTILTMALFRRFYGLRRYLTLDQFWGLAKPMLALSLFYAYLWWADFLTGWYGRIPKETAVIVSMRSFGPNLPVFAIAFICCFVLPLGILMWNPWRKSIAGPTIVAVIILIGTFFQRTLDWVATYLVTQPPTDHELKHVPVIPLPNAVDLMIILGALAGATLLVMLATKIVGPLSNWEMQEGRLLRVHHKLMRAVVPYVIKPE